MQISDPRVDVNTRGLDFGKGFYLSTSIEQARGFALRFADLGRITKLGLTAAVPTVSEYEFDLELAERIIAVKRFESPNHEWFDFVVSNRSRIAEDVEADIVIGPIADDQVLTTIRLYEDGVISRDEAMTRFLAKRLDDQFVIKSESALRFLKFLRATEVSESE